MTDLEVDRCPYCDSPLKWWWNIPDNGATCTKKCEGRAVRVWSSREEIQKELTKIEIMKMEGNLMKDEMSYEEFIEQEKYCKENNTPEGIGCTGCPGEHSVCADNIRNLIGKIEGRKENDV